MALTTNIQESWPFTETSGNGTGLRNSTLLTHSGVPYEQGVLLGVKYNGLTDKSTVVHASDPVSNYNAAWSTRIVFEFHSQMSAGDDWIYSKWNNIAGQNYFALLANGTSNEFRLHSAGGAALSLGTNTTGVLHDIVITGDGLGTLKAYRDGKLIGTAADGGDAMTGSADIRIATRSSSQFANITVNHINTWSDEKTASDVIDLSNGRSFLFDNGTAFVAPNLPLNYLLDDVVSFNESSGNSVGDISTDVVTVTGADQSITNPAFGNGIEFDGVADLAFFATAASGPLNGNFAQPFTVVELINQITDDVGNITHANGAGADDKFYFQSQGSGDVIAGRVRGQDSAATGSLSNGLHMQVLTSDGLASGDANFYNDGVLISNFTAGATTADGTGNAGRVTFGRKSANASLFWNGQMGQVLFYTREISLDEVIELWNDGDPLIRDPVTGLFAPLSVVVAGGIMPRIFASITPRIIGRVF